MLVYGALAGMISAADVSLVIKKTPPINRLVTIPFTSQRAVLVESGFDQNLQQLELQMHTTECIEGHL